MILADTSVWVDHLRAGNTDLARLLDRGRVCIHPFIVGEIALGSLRRRHIVLTEMRRLPQVAVAEHREIMHFIEHEALFGIGIGYVDAHLLASVRLTPEAVLWTGDKSLFAAARQLSLSAVGLG